MSPLRYANIDTLLKQLGASVDIHKVTLLKEQLNALHGALHLKFCCPWGTKGLEPTVIRGLNKLVKGNPKFRINLPKYFVT